MKSKRGNKFYKRLIALGAVILFLLSTNAARIFYLQIVRGEELAQKAESQQTKDTEITAMRGTIYDANGNVLAQSATVWNIYLDPLAITISTKDDATEAEKKAAEEKTEKRRQLVVDEFTKLFNYDEEQKAAFLKKTYAKNHYEVVEKKVENDIKEQISEFISDNDLNCIGMEQTAKRYYPYNNLASSVLGFTSSDGKEGVTGLESYYNEQLTGSNGRIITAKDAYSNNIDDGEETSIEATDGDSIVTTIDQTIQYYLEKGLRETLEEYQAKGAYGVVMNCNTGAVLGMASLPDYDCNNPYTLTYSKDKKAISKIKDKTKKATAEKTARENQWRNFTVNDTYVPGSVFKTFTAAAALEENVVTPKTTYTCTGSIRIDSNTVMKCHYHAGHGTQTFAQGLANSCNPFFITVGQKLGVHNYFKYFDAFGFTQLTNIDYPGEASPQYYPEEKYGIVELSSAAFGQTNSLTPIQVCTALSAVANGGKLLQPYLVSSIVDANGKTVSKTQTKVVRQVISEETSKTLREMMKGVVDEGTGKNGYVAGYRVGGKTGTSTKLGESEAGEGDKYIVSFAAIAPTDDPQLAMIIIVDEPNQDLGGGALCAPIAAQVIEQAMTEMGIEPKYDDDELKNVSKYTPSLTGKTISEAKTEASQYGVNVKVIGDGKTVTKQSPSADSMIPNGGTVYLYTSNTKKKTTTVPDFSGLTVNEAKSIAKSNNLNIQIAGNNMSSGTVVAYRQSEKKNTKVEQGTVVTVTFKNNQSVLD